MGQDVGSSPDTTTTTEQDFPETISVTESIEREEIEYLPENDSIRYVAAYRRGESGTEAGESNDPPESEPVYETIPFDDWAETGCASVGAKAVNSAMKRRLGTADGLATGITHENGRRIISITHQTMLDRDGDVVSESHVKYERVKRVAPKQVRATISLDSKEHTSVVPIETEQTTIQQQ
ncbi:hypothetical protein ACFFQF_13145 [Haladaptatus pallidirubidus]|uniref:Uncharacterized protein n=1 Tax=Haladaptatus pallidirubidus TaxID=1008152 RepID=A0AAV3UDN1_9EURY|nr:hypothetical protein [Haladaptatus pallidirubidus]